MKNNRFPFLIYIVALFLIMSWISSFLGDTTDGLAYSEVVDLFRNEQVKSFEVKDDIISMKLHRPYAGKTSLTASLGDADQFHDDYNDLFEAQKEAGVLVKYHFYPDTESSPYDFILPIVIAGLVLLFAWIILAGRANQQNPLQNFGRARTVLGVPDD